MSSNPEISKTTWQTGYKLSFKCCFLYAEKRVVQCYITVVFRCVCVCVFVGQTPETSCSFGSIVSKSMGLFEWGFG